MEKTFVFVVKMDTESACVNRLMFEECNESGFHFMASDNQMQSIDSASEAIRDYLGDMLEDAEW